MVPLKFIDVLSNNYALQAMQENLDGNGLRFHGQLLFTTEMVAEFYGAAERIIECCLSI